MRRATCSRRVSRRLLSGLVAVLGAATAATSAAWAEGPASGRAQLCAEPDPGLAGDWATTVSFDNDRISGGDSDSSYTTGLRVARSQAGYSPGRQGLREGPAYQDESRLLRSLRHASKGLEDLVWTPLSLLNIGSESPSAYRQSVGGGFSIFTPETTDQSVVPADQRPYAGSHYLFYGLEQDYCDEDMSRGTFLVSNKFVSSIEYQVGWIGDQPSQSIIEGFHDVWPAGGHTDGWQSRHLNYEPVFNVFYNRVWSGVPVPRLFKLLGWTDQEIGGLARPWTYDPLGLGVHFRPHAGFALGNAYTYGSAGVTVRAGLHLPENIGPPTIRPASPGSDYFRPYRKGEDRPPLSAYLFAGVEERAVLHNAFLDGNLFSESPSVDKKRLVDDRFWGLAVEWGAVRLSYTQVRRSPEFDGQGDTLFGAATLGVNIPLN